MIGEHIIENERGKITGMRVLEAEGGLPRVELTFQSTLKLLGIDANNLGTVTSRPKGDGPIARRGLDATRNRRRS